MRRWSGASYRVFRESLGDHEKKEVAETENREKYLAGKVVKMMHRALGLLFFVNLLPP